ncbi:MAG: hypothetical protein LBJ45_02170 [Holosporaceae bacterium]|nr:hypothetical protein [Holosporaceae bacterium]
MKSKLLKSSAFVLALFSSLSSQSEAMWKEVVPVTEESDIRDFFRDCRIAFDRVFCQCVSEEGHVGETWIFDYPVFLYALNEDGEMRKRDCVKISMDANPGLEHLKKCVCELTKKECSCGIKKYRDAWVRATIAGTSALLAAILEENEKQLLKEFGALHGAASSGEETNEGESNRLGSAEVGDPLTQGKAVEGGKTPLVNAADNNNNTKPTSALSPVVRTITTSSPPALEQPTADTGYVPPREETQKPATTLTQLQQTAEEIDHQGSK